MIRKAQTQIDLAKIKGKGLTFSDYEREIYHVSLVYNRLRLKYIGKRTISLSSNPIKARADKNWKHFENLYLFLKEEDIPLETYLKAQFCAFGRDENRLSIKGMYPDILASEWCRSNYKWYVLYCEQKGLTANIVRTEDEQLKLVFKSNLEMIENSKRSCPTPNIPELYHIILLAGSLSPLFLAANTQYVNFLNEKKLDKPDDLIKAIKKLEKDKVLKYDIFKLIRDLKDES